MSVLMTFRIAVKALGRNKMRTALTMLGMIIGVAAVIAMVALGSGAQWQIEEQIKQTGTNLVMIMPGNFSTGGVRMGGGNATTLKPEDATALRDVPGVQYVSATVNTRVQLIYANQNWSTNVQGSDVDYPAIRLWTVKYGSFFGEQDVRGATKVIVLGNSVSNTLFGEGVDPTGQIIRVRNQPFTVVGVMNPKGQSSTGQDQDDTAFAPYTTIMKKVSGNQNIQGISVSTASADEVVETAERVKQVLRERHKIGPGMDDDFTARTLEDMAATRTEMTRTMTSLLASIAGVSLLVGGIGIMNIMLVSVTERTREIGLRLAIGARGRDVLLQFLVEAVVISLFGGGIGVALGYGISWGVKTFMLWPAIVPMNAVFVAVAFAAVVGVFFGFYPARKAAGLDPIEALRFE
jgi:putative ABC transport system permease protein